MGDSPSPYRVALYNGPLRRDELSIMYTHVGGAACLSVSPALPDLICPKCGQDLISMMQYVLPDSTDDLHRVLYLFFCDSAHFAEHLRVVTVNIPITKTSPEKATEVEAPVMGDTDEKGAIDLLTGETTDSTTLLSLIKEGTAFMATRGTKETGKGLATSKTPALKRDGPIEFTLKQSPLKPYDVFSKPLELEEEEEDSEDEDGAEPLTPMEAVQRRYPKAILLYGYDAPPLLPAPFLRMVPDSGELVHVLDVFPTIISLLKLTDDDVTARNGVEFRSISIWSARSTAPGHHEGFAVVVPEEDLKLCTMQ